MRAIPVAALLIVGATACQPGISSAPTLTPYASLPTVTVRQVLTTQALVGETVVVTGRCLPDAGKPLAIGSRPMASNAWQLESGGVAIWVSGPKPSSCSADSEEQTLLAEVVQDSLPHLSRPRMVRQYLVAR